MKKSFLMLLAAFAVSVSTAFAQDQCRETCKFFGPTKGKVSTELSFNPFHQSKDVFQLDALRLRFFMTNKSALRFDIGFGVENETGEDYNKDQKTSRERKKKHGNFKMNLGYEGHFLQKGRVDLYAGLSLGIEKHNYSYHQEFYNGIAKQTIETDCEGIWPTDDYLNNNNFSREGFGEEAEEGQDDGPSYPNISVNKDNRSKFMFNVNFFTGIDFYVYKGLFIGAEFGMQLSTEKPGEYKLKQSDCETLKSTEESKTFRLEWKATPSFRIGWTF